MASFGNARNNLFSTTVENNSVSSNGPRSKCDQVVFEALCKACEIIVGGRTAGPGSSRLQKLNAGSLNNVTSTRFNLQVPEIHGIREIMSQYKLHLHVPVRLDVYYQPADNGNSRILLERWCLEYRHCASVDKFLEVEGLLTTQKQDAMAQLRHVWKRVVIWLRTLYVFSRLLPSNSFQQNISESHNKIGFSLYLNHDGTDDTELLVQQQGFLRQKVPSGTVTTPYGQLSSVVVYLPMSALHILSVRLNDGIEHSGNNSGTPVAQRNQKQSDPIPVSNNGFNLSMNRSSSPDNSPATNNPLNNLRPSSYSGKGQQNQHLGHKNSFVSFDPANLIPPRKHDTNLRVQRRHTTIGSETAQNDAEKPPERVMSGLSLALMMASIDGGTNPTSTQSGAEQWKSSKDETKDSSQDKRRAALHQMPPHLLEQQQTALAISPRQQPSTSGEYGYGYNNHIPTSKIHLLGGQSLVTQAMRSNSFDSRSASPSPFSLQYPQNTPPTAAFLGPGIATPVSRPRSGSVTSVSAVPNALTGHRSRSDSNAFSKHEADSWALGGATPPFRERPDGFIQAACVATAKDVEVAGDTFDREQARLEQYHLHTAHQLASLDLLHSSPFQLPIYHQSSALPFSSGNSAGMASGFDAFHACPDWHGSELSAHIPLLSAGDQLPENDSCFYEDTMPFAVDLPGSALSQLAQNQIPLRSENPGADPGVGYSRAVASLAERCAASGNRLSFFDNMDQPQSEISGNFERILESHNDLVTCLADQLEEFRSFNLSLHQETSTLSDRLES